MQRHRNQEMMSALRPDIKLLDEANPWELEPLVFTIFCLRFLLRLNSSKIVECLWPNQAYKTLFQQRVDSIVSEYRWKVKGTAATNHSPLVHALREAINWQSSFLEPTWDREVWFSLLEQIGVENPLKHAVSTRKRRQARQTAATSSKQEPSAKALRAQEAESIIPEKEFAEVEGWEESEPPLVDLLLGEPADPALKKIEQELRRETTETVEQTLRIADSKRTISKQPSKKERVEDGLEEVSVEMTAFPSPRPILSHPCPRCRRSDLVLQQDEDGSYLGCIPCGYRSGQVRPLGIDDEGEAPQRRRRPSHGKIRL